MEKINNVNLTNLESPIMLSWDVTNKCNLHCKHCFNSSADTNIHNFNDELNFNQVKDLIKQVIEEKPYSFCICGGEPTLFPYLEYVAKSLTKEGINTNMVSNGYFIDLEKAKWIKKIGIGLVQVSLDGAKPETHDKFRCFDGAFEKAVKALELLNDVGLDTAVSFCPNKKNLEEFKDLVKIAHKVGCTNIRIMPLLPMGRGLKNFKDLSLDNNGYVKLMVYISEMKIKFPDVRIEWGDPIEHLYIANYIRDVPICIEIKSNGDIGISNYLPITVGNVKRHTIKEYWDAGLKNIWKDKRAKHFSKQIISVYDFAFLDIPTWNTKRYKFDLIDNYNLNEDKKTKNN